MEIKYIKLKRLAIYLGMFTNSFGEYSVMSIGSACGVFCGLRNPFVVRLKNMETGEEKSIYLPSMEEQKED